MSPGVLDFRVRLAPDAGAPGRLLAAMDAHGIDRAAVTAGGILPLDQLAAQIVYGGHSEAGADNARILAVCAGSGGRLLPIYFANPHDGAEAYRAVAHQFRGLELSPAVHGVGLDDPRTVDLVRVAADAGHSVYVVCLGQPGTRTADLVTLAEAFAAVTFVLGHGGFLGIDVHAINQIAPRPNILVETSGCFTVVAAHALAHLGPERVLFGTEFPLQHPAVELAKYASLGLAPSVWAQVSWHNALRALGEPAEPRSRNDAA